MSDFAAHLAQLVDQHGVELEPEHVRWLYDQSRERGFTAEATEAAFSQLIGSDDGDDFDDDDFDADDGYDDYDFDDDEDAEPAQDDAPDPRLVADLLQGFESVQRKLGRKLTRAESEAALQDALSSVERGSHAGQAIEDAAGNAKSLVEMSDSEHTAFLHARLADRTPEPEPPDRALDLSDNTDFHEYAKARLAGVKFEDVEEEY